MASSVGCVTSDVSSVSSSVAFVADDYRDYYTEESKAIVERVYAKYIEVFNYSFESKEECVR